MDMKQLRLLVGILIALPALAGEYAVLENGFRIYADRHEVSGEHVRLYTSDGVIEFPRSRISHFEPVEAVPRTAETAVRVSPAPVPAPPARVDVKELVSRAARRAGLPEELVHSVALAESAYRVDAVSPKGAIGIMQLMPGTARALEADPTNPEQNAEAGARYLRELLLKYQHDEYQVEKALAAYNAGPGAVDRYRGVPPFRETRNYVEKVLKNYQKQLKNASK
jgi:soluble lytic murein transglycosylase-like protein